MITNVAHLSLTMAYPSSCPPSSLPFKPTSPSPRTGPRSPVTNEEGGHPFKQHSRKERSSWFPRPAAPVSRSGVIQGRSTAPSISRVPHSKDDKRRLLVLTTAGLERVRAYLSRSGGCPNQGRRTPQWEIRSFSIYGIPVTVLCSADGGTGARVLYLAMFHWLN